MTIDDALKIIDPATTRLALEPYAYDPAQRVKVVEDACRLLVSELRKRLADERNDPLTLDEIRAMVGEPVVLVTGDIQEKEKIITGWEILDHHATKENLFFFTRRTRGFLGENYGITWLAYRRPPKEGEAK